MHRAIALTAMILATPTLAGVLGTQLKVTPQGAADFTVAFRSGAETVDYWCAAGNFVTNTLAMPDRTRVYRASPTPRQAGQGIAFTLDPTRSVGETGVTTYGGPQDGSFSAGGAWSQFCSSRKFRP